MSQLMAISSGSWRSTPVRSLVALVIFLKAELSGLRLLSRYGDRIRGPMIGWCVLTVWLPA